MCITVYKLNVLYFSDYLHYINTKTMTSQEKGGECLGTSATDGALNPTQSFTLPFPSVFDSLDPKFIRHDKELFIYGQGLLFISLAVKNCKSKYEMGTEYTELKSVIDCCIVPGFLGDKSKDYVLVFYKKRVESIPDDYFDDLHGSCLVSSNGNAWNGNDPRYGRVDLKVYRVNDVDLSPLKSLENVNLLSSSDKRYSFGPLLTYGFMMEPTILDSKILNDVHATSDSITTSRKLWILSKVTRTSIHFEEYYYLEEIELNTTESELNGDAVIQTKHIFSRDIAEQLESCMVSTKYEGEKEMTTAPLKIVFVGFGKRLNVLYAVVFKANENHLIGYSLERNVAIAKKNLPMASRDCKVFRIVNDQQHGELICFLWQNSEFNIYRLHTDSASDTFELLNSLSLVNELSHVIPDSEYVEVLQDTDFVHDLYSSINDGMLRVIIGIEDTVYIVDPFNVSCILKLAATLNSSSCFTNICSVNYWRGNEIILVECDPEKKTALLNIYTI